jgi:6-phosphogluconolactonase
MGEGVALVAGSYAKAGGPGLLPFRLEDGRLVAGEPIPAIANASAGLFRDGRWYLVDEAAGTVSVHDRDWREVARIGSGGDAPCHLALDPAGGRLAVANYESGTVALFTLADGVPEGAPAIHQDRGTGPDRDRQAGPHAHWVGFDPAGAWLYACDLGADRVFALPVASDGFGGVQDALVAPPGSGPRQMAFHPSLPRAYLLTELASTLTVLDRVDGRLLPAGTLSTLPADAGDSLGGGIVLNGAGDRLYVSNRGHDSIATFALDPTGGATLLGHVSSGGRSPRALLLAGGHLLVAHEQEGGVTALPLDPAGRPLPHTARLDLPGACFLALATA